jgi:hypothetical protein
VHTIYIFIEKAKIVCAGVVIALHPRMRVIMLIMAVNLLTRWTHQSPINDKPPLAAGLATGDLIFRLNYGLVAAKQQKVCVADGFWTHVFHINLPKATVTPLPANGTTNVTCVNECRKVLALQKTLMTLSMSFQSAVQKFVERIYDLIPDFEGQPKVPRMRQSRGLIDAVGNAFSWAFGTATEGEIEDMKKAFELAKTQAVLAAKEASRSREGLATFTRLQNERLDNLKGALEAEQQSIRQLYTRIQEEHEISYFEVKAISVIATEIAKFVGLHDDVMELAHAIGQLAFGELSPKLIEVSELTDLLKNITQVLRKTGYRLCHATAREVYAGRNFDFARQGSDLIIRLRMPITRWPDMNVYQTTVFAMAEPSRIF